MEATKSDEHYHEAKGGRRKRGRGESLEEGILTGVGS
jgi:hypothetical protein